MRAAVIDQNTNTVTGVIMADANVDLAPANTVLVNLSEGSEVGIGWTYDSVSKSFTNPFPVVGES